MSCCPGPEHGKPFDPDLEAPSEDDMARFAGDDDEDFYDDHAFDEQDEERWDETRKRSGIWVAAAGAALIGFLLLTML